MKPPPLRHCAVVGAGPNGLAAAVALARAGVPTCVHEAQPTPGGGARTAALTLPGFRHDVCSAAHPLARASPFLRSLDLAAHGLRWVEPPAALAHPFDDGSAALLLRSPAATAATLDGVDRGAYRQLVEPLLAGFDGLLPDLLAPPLHLPRRPLQLLRFGRHALRSAEGLACSRFAGPRARALFGGIAAHALAPLEAMPTAAAGLLLLLAGHAFGWPFAAGGSQAIADALAAELRRLGGNVEVGQPIADLRQLDAATAVLLDLTPAPMLRLCGDRLSARERRRLQGHRYGPGVFKIDWALAQPIPWRAAACAEAGTVHLGGELPAIAASSRRASRGQPPADPLVILTQPSRFDPGRAPPGRHTAWAYIHVPFGCDIDHAALVERQVERFAPGFRDSILARHTRTAAALARHNPNCVGGDINGGSQRLRQLLFGAGSWRAPYATSDPRLFLCSSSTPPGGGVHGMCGYHAAQALLRRCR